MHTYIHTEQHSCMESNNLMAWLFPGSSLLSEEKKLSGYFLDGSASLRSPQSVKDQEAEDCLLPVLEWSQDENLSRSLIHQDELRA